jgi:hypothetical protein
MADQKVDLSQIRGDWDFHSHYVTHAMDQTLKRANKLWRELHKSSRKKDQVPVDGQLMDDFREAIYQAKGLTDDYFTLADCKPTAKDKAAIKKAKKKAKKKAAKKKAKKKTKKKAKKETTGKEGVGKESTEKGGSQ